MTYPNLYGGLECPFFIFVVLWMTFPEADKNYWFSLVPFTFLALNEY